MLNYVCDIVLKGSRSLSLICWWALVYFAPGIVVRSIVVSVFVCLFVCFCLSVRLRVSKPTILILLCYLRPWLGPLTAMRFVMYFRFCGWRNCSQWVLWRTCADGGDAKQDVQPVRWNHRRVQSLQGYPRSAAAAVVAAVYYRTTLYCDGGAVITTHRQRLEL